MNSTERRLVLFLFSFVLLLSSVLTFSFSSSFLFSNVLLLPFSGQLISDEVSEIFTRFDKSYITPYGNTLTTKSAGAQYDDSYLGNRAPVIRYLR